MHNVSSGLLRSLEDLAAESYNYFESISDICKTKVSMASALIGACDCLTKMSSKLKECTSSRLGTEIYYIKTF